MKENESRNVKNQGDVKGRGLFYSVIAVATFIIMAVGATFAYFTATTNSTNTSVKTGSTTLKLQYIGYEDAWMSSDLIPADTNVVEYSFEYQNDLTKNSMCKDDYSNSICSVYVFQVKNSNNSPQNVSLDVVTTTNEFGNLYAMAYELIVPTENDPESTDDDYDKYFPVVSGEEPYDEKFYTDSTTGKTNGAGDPRFKTSEEDEYEGSVAVRDGDGNFLQPSSYEAVYVNRGGLTKTLLNYYENEGHTTKKPAIDRAIKVISEDPSDNVADIADDITIDGNSIKTFALVLYIKNIESDQTDADADKSFTGQVVVSSGDGKVGVSGSIGITETKVLQSGDSLLGTDTTE